MDWHSLRGTTFTVGVLMVLNGTAGLVICGLVMMKAGCGGAGA